MESSNVIPFAALERRDKQTRRAGEVEILTLWNELNAEEQWMLADWIAAYLDRKRRDE